MHHLKRQGEGGREGGKRQSIYKQAKTAITPTSMAAVLLSSLLRPSAAAPVDCVEDGFAAPDDFEAEVCFAPEGGADVGLLLLLS